jgi:hypothetical protein
MDANDGKAQHQGRCEDVILYQRIGGGWEYRCLSGGETYVAFAFDASLAQLRLMRQLGWGERRFYSADFRKF